MTESNDRRHPGEWRRRPLILYLLLPLLAAVLQAAAPPPQDDSAAEETPTGETTPGEPLVIEERMTVTGSRLRGDPRELRVTPNNVTVITGEQIEASGARTLQELLADEAGVVLFDQVGDGVSRTFDLRGFQGTGTRVLLDGAPINDSRNNSLALELVPLAALERIEIVRGSTATLAGGGSEAGVLNLWTRKRRLAGGSWRLAAGQDDTLDAAAELGGRVWETDLFVSGSAFSTDGYRVNGDGDLTRFALTAARQPSDNQSFQASLVSGHSEFGSPGALTADELAADRRQAPFNRLDYSDELARQLTLNYDGVLTGQLSLAANLFARDRGSEILSTGRAAPRFGGFFLDSEADTLGATVELRRRWGDRRGVEMVAGAEWFDGSTDALGFFTSPTDPGVVNPNALGSDNLSERATTAFFVQGTWSPAPAWSVVAGARFDDDRVDYSERLPDPANRAARSFSEVSLRTGVNYSPDDRWGVYASYGESYLPPTIEELFAFPLFGSNRDLDAEDSSSWELGGRRRFGRLSADVAVFRIDTEDEIVFDVTSPLGPFGANVNAGRTRRQGAEASLRGPLTSKVRGFANLTLMQARFRGRSDLAPGDPQPAATGRALPLVPEERLTLGADAELPRGLALRATWLYVGEQPLDNDDVNAREPLAAYSVLDARLTWRPRREAADGGWSIFLDAHNLLDERYSTRGIFAFDFASFSDEEFFTPAPGRRLSAGARWSF